MCCVCQWNGTHLFVTDILQGVRHDCNAHVYKITASHFEYLLTEFFAIFVNFLNRHWSHNRTLMALERDKCDVLDLWFRFAQKLFASSLKVNGLEISPAASKYRFFTSSMSSFWPWIFTWAIPVTEMGTPWLVYTVGDSTHNVIVFREILWQLKI